MSNDVQPQQQSENDAPVKRPIARSPFWVRVIFSFGAFLHLLPFLITISPYQRPILIGAEPVRDNIPEDEGMNLAEMVVTNGGPMPEWFVTGLAVTSAISVFCLLAVVFLRKWGLVGYILATLAFIVITWTAGYFSPFLLIYPTFITVFGAMNKDLLRW